MEKILNLLLEAWMFIDCPEMFFAATRIDREQAATYAGNGYLRGI